MVYDLIIVGMGPGGISAAIYAKRAGLNIMCLDKNMPGGYLNFIDKIDNYPGYFDITGPELSYKFNEHLKYLDVNVVKQNVVDIIDGDVKKVVTDKSEYLCKFVILATGRVSRKLGILHEDELLGRGLSHCALCDGNLYKGKDVAVIGGGRSALQEAMYLSKIVNKVYIIHRRKDFSVNDVLVDDVLSNNKIVTCMERTLKEFLLEDKKLVGIKLDDDSVLNVACVFSYIGYVPDTRLSLDIMNEKGYIEVNNNYESKRTGIYAVGDIIEKDVYQIVNAASEGALAATDIAKKCK